MSVQDRVGAGVVTLLSGLAWGDGVSPLVVQRKRPEVAEQDATSATRPTVVVVVRRGRTEVLCNGAVQKVLQTYTVGVAVAIPTPQTLGDTGPMASYVELARKAVHGDGTLPGVPESNEIRPTDQAPWDAATLDKNFEWGTLAFDVECIERRDLP